MMVIKSCSIFFNLHVRLCNLDPKIAAVVPSAKGGKAKDSKQSKPKKGVIIPPKLVIVEPPNYLIKNWSSLAKRGQSSNKQVFF